MEELHVLLQQVFENEYRPQAGGQLQSLEHRRSNTAEYLGGRLWVKLLSLLPSFHLYFSLVPRIQSSFKQV